ncbi:MAG TPA: 3-hydroxyacyl-CoA dehydrogenase NAD-binding domain-containing protein, partial [Bryobacteraceae bacterium]|nr:3-hydroxyacyl-CoA dehydrogenase NAD-binding domain-containing protein [Bryobacteraceae bacterium]
MLAESALRPAPDERFADRRAPALIRKAAVLGAGTMGSRIAAHLANAGLNVVLLDVASEAPPRSAAAAQALEGLKKAKPAAFFEPSLAGRITVGNFEDDMAMLAGCDWVIEAVTENLEIKQALLEKAAAHLKPEAIFTTNTSGLSVTTLAAKLPEEIRR